jgi:hypothetical protein
MSITDVISNPGQLLSVTGAHFKQAFRARASTAIDTAIIELESGPVTQ